MPQQVNDLSHGSLNSCKSSRHISHNHLKSGRQFQVTPRSVFDPPYNHYKWDANATWYVPLICITHSSGDSATSPAKHNAWHSTLWVPLFHLQIICFIAVYLCDVLYFTEADKKERNNCFLSLIKTYSKFSWAMKIPVLSRAACKSRRRRSISSVYS